LIICNHAENTQDAIGTIREVRSRDIYLTSKDLTETVLRHLYGLSWFEDFNEAQEMAGTDWVDLCDAAEGFEVPSLRKYIKDKLEARLESLLVKGLPGPEVAMERFVTLITDIYKAEVGERTAVMEVIAKMITKYHPALCKHATFGDLMEESLGDCSRFFGSVADYAAREGLRCAK
jgi:hypothetical protein